MSVEKVLEQLKRGGMVVIYDGDEREGEADLCIHAQYATPEVVRTLRKDGGGLICLALSSEIAKRLELPFYTDILAASKHPLAGMECKKAAYGDKPAFSIPVNHKNVYTGITDIDRSRTITRMSELAEDKGDIRTMFMEEFYSPGHVFLLIGRGIENRHGHTELNLELARRAGMSGAMVLCEMLGLGRALSKQEAWKYAEKNGSAFLEGKDLWQK